MTTPIQISVDLLVILRLLMAVFWGIGWAIFLQQVRLGEWLADKRTWLTVVVGAGVDLLIAYRASYFEVLAIIALSSLGIIFRSLVNEHQAEYEPDGNSYKLKWRLEEVIDLHGEIVGALESALEKGDAKPVSRALAAAHRAQRIMTIARYGEPEKNGHSR